MAIAELLDPDLPRNSLGEGAVWDHEHGRLLWVDITARRFHLYDLATKTLGTIETRLPVSFVFPYSGNRFLVGLADGLYLLDQTGKGETPVALLSLPEKHRMNDGKCDPAGRLWAGTINEGQNPAETAALYRLGEKGLLEVEGGYTNANGKTWSPDGRVMYHADTGRGVIWQYDYDSRSGAIGSKRVFVNLGEDKPDGLTSDAEGNVFAAIYGGARISVFSPRGAEVERIDLPVPNATSCAFGGNDLRQLFITTASQGMDEKAMHEAPLSGRVFVATCRVAGLPSPQVALPAGMPYKEK